MTDPTAPPSAAAQVSTQVTAQETMVRGTAVWLPPGSPPVTLGDYSIAGGMVYLGTAAPAAYAATYEPALIDPREPVRRVRLDNETPAEGERPAYGNLTPGARAAYLEWLAGGRTTPTPAAHLWLFLYGLERRILIDLAGTLGSQEEYAAIAAEVTALRERYPHLTAFQAQAAEFADLLDSLIGLNDPALQPPPPGPRTGDLPMRLRVGIGRYVGRRLPVSAGWAFAWYAYSPQRVWGPAAMQRPEEFRRAFAARYAEAYPGGGIAVTPTEQNLVLQYRPASPGFADRTVRIHTHLPDVGSLAEPLEQLAAVAARAEADLSGGIRPRPTEPAATDPVVVTPVAEKPETGPIDPPPAAPGARSAVVAAEALLRLVSVAGVPDEGLRATRRHIVAALNLTAPERQSLDDRLHVFAHRRPDATVVKRRFAALAPDHQRAVTDLMIATAGAHGVVEPAQTAVLGAVFDALGAGGAALRQRLHELEVAAVVDESTLDVIALDDAHVRQTLAGAATTSAVVDALVSPLLSRSPAACP